MSKLRSLGVAAVFLAGCAVGGASARFVVPPASAQQAASFPRWEYYCAPGNGRTIQEMASGLGAQGWDLTGTISTGDFGTWCFKRPKM